MVAYTKPQQWKKEERERLRGERDQIQFIVLTFERWQVVRCREARGGLFMAFQNICMAQVDFSLFDSFS